MEGVTLKVLPKHPKALSALPSGRAGTQLSAAGPQACWLVSLEGPCVAGGGSTVQVQPALHHCRRAQRALCLSLGWQGGRAGGLLPEILPCVHCWVVFGRQPRLQHRTRESTARPPSRVTHLGLVLAALSSHSFPRPLRHASACTHHLSSKNL